MENVLMNWSHILSASMKNQAAVETLTTASQMGDVVSKITPLGKDNMGKDQSGNVVSLKGTVKVMQKGETVHYRIDDDLLFAQLGCCCQCSKLQHVDGHRSWIQNHVDSFHLTVSNIQDQQLDPRLRFSPSVSPS
jgi:hypothetical protein